MHKQLQLTPHESNRLVLCELSTYFGEETGEQLFTTVHLWYYSQPKTRERSVEEEAESAYATFLHDGTLPVFFTLLDVILKARRHLPLKVYKEYLREHSPKFWRYVFIEYYGQKPHTDKDPYWDELFRIGMPLLHMLEENE